MADADTGSEVYHAVGDFATDEEGKLSLRCGDKVRVLEKVNETWWWVEVNGEIGYAPANHLSLEQPDMWQDDYYFSSYEALKLHLEMLSDRPRTLAYREAICKAANFVKDKVVLDLGCGTGILSLFCAKLANAKKVYAVDASAITEHAIKIIEQNGLSDKIEVNRCRGEDLQLSEKVDLIISEWMGTLLLFELMVESVLITRDRCLKEGGVMWPSSAELFLVPCSATSCYTEKVKFWEDVYGFDFSPMIPIANTEMFGRPIYNHILHKEDCLADPISILKLDMKTVTADDLEASEACFDFTVTASGVMNGFGSWFDVEFGSIPDSYNYTPITLSTSPWKPLTHWKQDLMMMDQPIVVRENDKIEGKITITRNKIWRRHLLVHINFCHISNGTRSNEHRKEFKLWR